MRNVVIFTLFLLLLLPVAAEAAGTLNIVSSGPTGEIGSLAEANEIRLVFSEPMVSLGKIPDPLQIPFVKIKPALRGTWRWSGTTILIFTPDPDKPLPYATKYEVTVDTTAKSVAGNSLTSPHSFAFTTPTTKLLSTNWYRKGGRYDASVVVVLYFNQPVKPAEIAKHLLLRYQSHSWPEPSLEKNARDFLAKSDPTSLEKFDAKVAATRAAAQATGPVVNFLADSWDTTRYAKNENMVVVETKPGVPTDSWVQLMLDERLPSAQGNEVPGRTQEFTIQLERTLFIEATEHCRLHCDPDRWNAIRFRARVSQSEAAKAFSVSDVTKAPAEKKVKQTLGKPSDEIVGYDATNWMTLEEAGFGAQPPVTTWRVKIGEELTAHDGQKLGYSFVTFIENWHRCAYASFGDGHGVWEADAGATLPFYSRNFKMARQWASPLTPDELMPTILRLQEESYFRLAPDSEPTDRKLGVSADKVQSHGLDLSAALGSAKYGIFWTAVEPDEAIAKAVECDPDRPTRASLVQVTNLGIHVKDSPINTLVFVTRLDDGKPVAGANVAIRSRENKVLWSGTTEVDGVAIAPNTDFRGEDDYWKIQFIVTAEKDGDFAYVGSDWDEGINGWEFGIDYSRLTAKPMLRGAVFADRGVYKPGEEVHFKAILRSDTAAGMKLLAPDTKVAIVVTDSVGEEVDRRDVTLSEWSSAEWTMQIKKTAALGDWSIMAATPEQHGNIYGNFLVASYRRPDFRVDATLASGTGIAGDPLDGHVEARYLFGGAMADREISWTFRRSMSFEVPPPIAAKYPLEQWMFTSWMGYDEGRISDEILEQNDETLDDKGNLELELETKTSHPVAMVYTLEGSVTDVSRQVIANRASLVVHPAPWYIGVKQPPMFADQKSGFDTEVLAVTPEGLATPDVDIKVEVTQLQWNSVRRAEGNGFYTWDWELKRIEAGSYDVKSAAKPVPLHLDFKNGGYFELVATATDDRGRSTRTSTNFYVLGEGYTAWRRYDHNRIDLVPEKKKYRPGETARIMVQSPWENATALVTTEREGIRTHRQFELKSTQQTIDVPITEADIPNVFVSVVLVQGRTMPPKEDDPSDPGKPSFRLGYIALSVEDATKRLKVDVRANQSEYRPATNAKISVNVKDAAGKPSQSEVTLWAVDYGVLSLTNFQTPDILGDVYVEKSLSVQDTDSRQRIISRRVLTPKGADEGGGGGADESVGEVRKDFRVLAFWLGSVKTDRKGSATTEVKLPESLTTYRIMAVANDKANRFGKGDSEIKVNKPVLLRQNFPRFLSAGDKAFFGSVVNSQLTKGGQATVTIESLNPEIISIEGVNKQTIEIEPKGAQEVRFPVVARAVGDARIRMTVRLLGESDAFEDVIPVRILSPVETVAAYGQAKPDAKESVEIPGDVRPDIGGIDVELSSTALVGLGEGARYLVDYPYGCAEQRASTAIALMLASDLGDAFHLPGIAPADIRKVAQDTLVDLERYQCPDGGFWYWPGECLFTSPYLTSYILHVYQRGESLGYEVDDDVMTRAYDYLELELTEKPPVNEGWWPSYTAWQAYAIKVLAEGGRNQDSNVNRIYGYLDRMPVFALSHLYDALAAKGENDGRRVDELRRRIFNAILPEGGSAHVEELADDYLLLFWNSNIRSTSLVLGSLVRNSDIETHVASTVRWLMNARKKGRWGNTQENALAMEALVDYYKKYESEIPDFSAVVTLGEEEIAKEGFKGRSTVAKNTSFPMKSLLAKGAAGKTLPLTFNREGTGVLYYIARLRYASMTPATSSMNKGFQIKRTYSLENEPAKSGTSYAAGDLVRVTLELKLPKERRWVAVTDPLPAGFEPVESWFATTALDLRNEQRYGEEAEEQDWMTSWRKGGFDHIERHDDRVNLFATRLSAGTHVFSYVARATTAGNFIASPVHAEEMYEPEVFGRSKADLVEVKP
ncbi:MAG: Ig-like domain-containing protein [Acidobacteria bacterium]|nr:Ig-like domain-containing protein [Acidobacteriota bacterium]